MPSEAPAPRVIDALRAVGARIAVAESLTGGLVLSELISVPGASAVVRGGVVAYDTALKASLLGVDRALLARTGPVDAEVARQMARGARLAGETEEGAPEFGLATTGVAGPDPDPQTGLAPGTVFLGVSSVLGERAVALALSGDRSEIRAAAVTAAFAEILSEISRVYPPPSDSEGRAGSNLQ